MRPIFEIITSLSNRRARRARDAVYGEGKRTPMNRAGKNDVLAFADDYNAANKTGRQHQGPLTAATLRVLKATLFGFHNQHTGRCDPGLRAIAKRARCSRSTAALAIKALEQAGIMTWVNRLGTYRVAKTGLWTTRLKTNAYRFLIGGASDFRPGTKTQGSSRSYLLRAMGEGGTEVVDNAQPNLATRAAEGAAARAYAWHARRQGKHCIE